MSEEPHGREPDHQAGPLTHARAQLPQPGFGPRAYRRRVALPVSSASQAFLHAHSLDLGAVNSAGKDLLMTAATDSARTGDDTDTATTAAQGEE